VFGDYQDFIDMEKFRTGLNFGIKTPNANSDNPTVLKLSDPREYRPLEVTVSCTLHDIRAHLLKVICEKRLNL